MPALMTSHLVRPLLPDQALAATAPTLKASMRHAAQLRERAAISSAVRPTGEPQTALLDASKVCGPKPQYPSAHPATLS